MRTNNLSQNGILSVLLISFLTFRTDKGTEVQGLHFKMLCILRQTFSTGVVIFNGKISPDS
jgi:hypothetical protein